MSKVLQERGFGSLPSLTETNPRDQVKSISTTIGDDSNSICRIGSGQYAISTGQNRALMNVPIFVGTFSMMTDFAVLENMDVYRDEGMGDVIFGEPFLREADIKAKRFDGMITLYKGDDKVTYQMV
ncbi:hypothetical protein Tco_0956043 [Tanacetum coccineum]|uniref:Uncharacterized protein n=1 Tax=Tanacetum coccineum TaxID=301880 RepID=A0ABQ5E8U5_9ASTR